MAFSLTGLSEVLQHKETKDLIAAWEHMYLTENVLQFILKNTASLHFLYGALKVENARIQFFVAAVLTLIGDPISCIMMDRMNARLMRISYDMIVQGYTGVDLQAIQNQVMLWSVLYFVRGFEPLIAVWFGLVYMPVF